MLRVILGGTGVGVYFSQAGGIPAEVVEGPYLSSDGQSLMGPLPVMDVDAPTYRDEAGNLLDALELTDDSE